MIEAPESEIDESLEKLQQAYALVFDKNNPHVQLVLDDLKRFCRINESCFHPDARIHAVLEGRREVGLRLDDFSSLSFKDLKNKIIIRNANNRRRSK